MIGYFVGAGDIEAGKMFDTYLHGENGFANLLKDLKKTDYGEGLNLLLIEFYIEGNFSTIFDVDKIKTGNYSNKNKDISVKVPVKRTDFHDRTENERRQFIVSTTLKAIELVENRLAKLKLGINFDLLKKDVTNIGKLFIEKPK
ncbi:MAG: hypothetical protein K8S20_03085 [Chloroflexi bacterium]|nr:hypothetical protein [Chloroflexota bacterium]